MMIFTKEKEVLLKELKAIPNLMDLLINNDVLLCGGALTSVFSSNEINDYDLYFKNKKSFDKVNVFFVNAGYTPVFESSCAITYSLSGNYKSPFINSTLKIQLVKLDEYSNLSAKEIIDMFDFTVCQAAYSFKEDSFIINENFLSHLLEKKLVFNTKALYPIVSIFRIKKYEKRGYKIDVLELIKLIMCINQLNLTTYGDVARHIKGFYHNELDLFVSKLNSYEYKNKKFDPNEFINLISRYEEEKNKNSNILEDIF